jgi:hypothetical protein
MILLSILVNKIGFYEKVVMPAKVLIRCRLYLMQVSEINQLSKNNWIKQRETYIDSGKCQHKDHKPFVRF